MVFLWVPTLAQNSTARINQDWQIYASDTSLTYRAIVTICDSLFRLAGYPAATDTAITDTAVELEHDGTPWLDYVGWKTFWANRLDLETGKLHDFTSAAIATLQADTGILLGMGQPEERTTGGCSKLWPTITPATSGWRYIGPQNIDSTTAVRDGDAAGINTLHQHLGQIHKILVNPNNADEVYASSLWGGLWKTSNASAAPNNTWVCLTDKNWWCLYLLQL